MTSAPESRAPLAGSQSYLPCWPGSHSVDNRYVAFILAKVFEKAREDCGHAGVAQQPPIAGEHEETAYGLALQFAHMLLARGKGYIRSLSSDKFGHVVVKELKKLQVPDLESFSKDHWGLLA